MTGKYLDIPGSGNLRVTTKRDVSRALELNRNTTFGVNQYLEFLKYNGHTYPFVPSTTYGDSKQEEPAGTFEGYIQAAYKSNGVIFACMLARLLLFSEARFQFRQLRSGRPGQLFGNEELQILETPWPNGTTGDLLTRAIQDVDLAGNFFVARRGDRLRRMRPDWVTIVIGSELEEDEAEADLDAEVVGYLYKAGGPHSSHDPIPLLPEQVCHFAPIPDPSARFRGMSWLTPVLRELMADNAMTDHRMRFFENGATPNMVVSTDVSFNKDSFKEWVSVMRDASEGGRNAYKTLYLGAGASAEVVGSNFQQIDFKVTQGAGETRIAAAAGVPPIIVGLSEGLQAATYSNYGMARRRFADGTMRPLWRSFAGSMASIIPIPGGAELWFDDRDIPFLQEDAKDDAEIRQIDAATMSNLIDAGYEPDSVREAVVAGDFNRLVHTGLVSVQLHAPGSQPNSFGQNGSAPVPAALRELEDKLYELSRGQGGA